MNPTTPSAPAFVYFDNAATTPLDPEVLEAMLPFLSQHYGNPSSLHGPGRQVRAAIENARKTVAHLINAAPAEITFTSGGTEADNYAAVRQHPHAGAEARHHLAPGAPRGAAPVAGPGQKRRNSSCSYLKHDAQGTLDLGHLEELLAARARARL